MILYTSPDGYTLTTDDLSELAYAAGKARGDKPKSRAEHAADDLLWSLGWFVPSRVPPDDRVTAGGKQEH